jgi:general secretion pathway protein N
MRQNRLLAGAGLTALVLSLIAMFPARVAVSLLGLPGTSVTGLSGTVWDGAVQRLSLGGLSLGPVRWQVKPSRLLLGQLAADVSATLPDGFLNTTAALSLGGGLAASNLEAAAPLAWLAPAMGDASSQLTARFDRVMIKNGRVETAIGSLQLAGVALPIPTAGPQLGPGTYQLTFNANNLGPADLLSGVLKDGGGPLEIAGAVKITPPRSYEITGTAKPRPNAPPELRNALQMLGPATPDGGHALSLAGSF